MPDASPNYPLRMPYYGGTHDPLSRKGSGEDAWANLLYAVPAAGYLARGSRVGRAIGRRIPEIVKDFGKSVSDPVAGITGYVASEAGRIYSGVSEAVKGGFKFKSSAEREEAQFEARRQANRELYNKDKEAFNKGLQEYLSKLPKTKLDRFIYESHLRTVPPELLPPHLQGKPFMQGKDFPLEAPKPPGKPLGSMEQYRLETIEMTDLGQSHEWAQEMQTALAEDVKHEHHTAAPIGGGYTDAGGRHVTRYAGGRGFGDRYDDGGGAGEDTSASGAEGVATGKGSPYLAHTRASYFAELDKDPQLRRDVIKTAAMEGGVQSNIEQMVNMAQMRGWSSLRRAIHSGFYGPVNRGGLKGGLSEAKRQEGERAIAAVRGGSNIIDLRTDQGLWSDPNGAWYKTHPNLARHKTVQGANFFDFRGAGPAWAARERQRMREYDAAHGGEKAAAEAKSQDPGASVTSSEPVRDRRARDYLHHNLARQAHHDRAHQVTVQPHHAPRAAERFISHRAHRTPTPQQTRPHLRRFIGTPQHRQSEPSFTPTPPSRSFAGVKGLAGSPSGPAPERPPKTS